MKVEESLNVTFDESPPPTKLSPLVDDDVGEEEAIRKNTKIVNTNNEEDESIEVEEIVNIKESKNHPLDQVIGNLNQRTLRSQAQNHSNLFCFISTIEPKNVNEALKDESWVVAMQEELNQFVANDVWELVPLPISQSVIGTKWVFRNKLDGNVRPYFWSRIRNGNATSAWFDNWSTFCTLSNVISNRNIYSAGYRRDSKVYEIINQGSWTWPNEWFLKYPLLGTAVVPNLSNFDDMLSWRNLDNSDVGFSVAAVWDCIRPRSNEVEWFHVVWFSYQIPRHAIHLWLVLKRKLKTQDLMRPWDVSCATNLNSLICSLCDLDGIVDTIIPLAKKRSARSVILKLVFAASCYFIWQERNHRLFKKTKRTPNQIINIIKSSVCLKLLSCTFKQTSNVQVLFHLWKLPNSLMRAVR
ncbi:retrovirus-related pol polyprotein from transposon TNT 1-94 [Tanacetum coccineum]